MDTYAPGQGTRVAFRIQAEAGLSYWSIWTGSTRLGFQNYEPTSAPTDVTDGLTVNMPDHPYPTGQWQITLTANDGVTTAKLAASFTISGPGASTSGGTPRAPGCTVDLNANGVPDCVEGVVNHFTPPLASGKPNYFVLIAGLVIFLSVGLVLLFRLQGGAA
jgi:hypothetical protein